MISDRLIIKARGLSSQVHQSIKHILIPCDLNREKIDLIFGIACRLKDGKVVRPLKSRIVTLLLNQDDLRTQTSVFKAAQILGMSLNVVIDSRMTTKALFVEDTGKLLSKTSDVILCGLLKHVRTRRLAKYSTVPVVNIHSPRYSIGHVLADLYTTRQHFGSLEGLTVALVCPPGPLINTYLPLTAMLGLKVKYHCLCRHTGEFMSPECLFHVKQMCQTSHSTVDECKTCSHALEGAHVVVIQATEIENMRIFKDASVVADKKWILLHYLPRGSSEVDEDIFDGPRNFTFESFGNAAWVSCGIICDSLGITSID